MTISLSSVCSFAGVALPGNVMAEMPSKFAFSKFILENGHIVEVRASTASRLAEAYKVLCAKMERSATYLALSIKEKKAIRRDRRQKRARQLSKQRKLQAARQTASLLLKEKKKMAEARAILRSIEREPTRAQQKVAATFWCKVEASLPPRPTEAQCLLAKYRAWRKRQDLAAARAAAAAEIEVPKPQGVSFDSQFSPSSGGRTQLVGWEKSTPAGVAFGHVLAAFKACHVSTSVVETLETPEGLFFQAPCLKDWGIAFEAILPLCGHLYDDQALFALTKQLPTDKVAIQMMNARFLEEKREFLESFGNTSQCYGFFDAIKAFASRFHSTAEEVMDVTEGADYENPVPSTYERFCEAAKASGHLVGTAAVIAVDKMKERTWRAFMRLFDSTIGSYASATTEAVSVVKIYLNKAKKWLDDALNCCNLAVQAVKNHVFTVLCLIIFSGVITMTENILFNLGFIPTKGNAASIFLTLALAFFGISKMSQNPGIFCEMQAHFRNLFAQCFATPTAPIHEEGRSAAFADIYTPINMMTSLGNSLFSINTGTIAYFGKLGQSMEGIRKGINCVKDAASFAIESLASIYYSATGKDVEFFAEIAALTRHDLKSWIKRAEKALLEFEVMKIRDRGMLDAMTNMIHEGQELRHSMLDHAGKSALGANYMRITSDLLKKIEEKRAIVAKMGDPLGRRLAPFWLYIYGPSHCGKSNAMNAFATDLLAEIGAPPTDILTVTPTDKFMSGYERQACIMIDDLGATEVAEGGIEREIINMVSCVDYRPLMADVESKGMIYDSPLLITSSNFYTAQPGIFNDRHAYENRRNVILECRRKTDKDIANGASPYYEGVPLSGMMCRALEKHSPAPIHTKSKDDVDQHDFGQWTEGHKMSSFILTEMHKHFEKERGYQAEHMHRVRGRHPIFIDSDAVLRLQNRLTMMEEFSRQGQTMENMAMAVDGKIVHFPVWQKDCPECIKSGFHSKVNEVSVYYGHFLKEKDHPEIDPICLEDRIMATIRRQGSVERTMFGMANPIVDAFLKQLVQKDVRVEGVDKKLSGLVTPAQRDFWEQLPLAEKFYLRLMQKRIDEIRKLPSAAEHVYIPRCIAALRQTGDWLWSNGAKILVLLLALVIIYTAAKAFLTLFACFISGRGAVEVLTKLDTFSVFPSSSVDAQSYRSRNTPLCYRTHTYSTNNGNPGKEYPIGMLVGLHTPQGQFVSCIRGKDRSILLTQHQARRIPDGAKVLLSYRNFEGTINSFSCIWNPTVRVCGGSRYGLFFPGETEVAIYRDPCLSPLPSANQSFFCSDYEAQLTPYPELKFVGLKLKQFGHANHISHASDTTPICHMWNGSGVVMYARHRIQTTESDGSVSYYNDLPKYIASTTSVGPEDCGTIVTTDLVVNNQTRQVIVGMVVGGGDGKDGRRKATIALIPELDTSETFSSINFEEEAGIDTEGVTKIGFIRNKQDRPVLPKKTQYQRVPEDLQLDIEVKKQPAIISKGDERLIGTPHEKFDPIHEAPNKYANPMKELPQDLLKETANDILKDWKQFLGNQSLKIESLDNALNGIEGEDYLDKMVENTSEGYPYVLSRTRGEKGKGRFLQPNPSDPDGIRKMLIPGCIIEKDLDILLNRAKTHIPELVCIDTPKDELLPLRKIFDKPKTRMFSICPFPYNLALRQYTLRLVAFLQTNRRSLAAQVGIVPQSQDWDNLYQRMCSMNADEGYNCDYSGFDGYLTAQVVDVIANMFNSMFAGETQNDQAIRYNLIMALVNRKVIAGSQVYEVRAGLPSGLALTVTINSIFNELLVRMAFKQLAPPVYRNSFHAKIFLAVYGDDNIITVHPDCKYFTGTAMKKVMSEWGVTITDGSDKTSLVLKPKPLSEIDFLKRSFSLQKKNQNDGLGIVAPLDNDAIYSCLHYYKPVGSEITTLVDSVRAALFELRLHKDRPKFESLRNFYLERRPYLKEEHVLPDWDEATALHMELKGKGTPYKPYQVLEFRLDIPKLKTDLTQHSGTNWCHAVERRISLAGNNYCPADSSDLFFISLGCNYPKGVNGIRVDYAHSHEGAGQQPTRMWMKRFRSSSNAETQKMREAYDAGKHLVFMSKGPFTASWLALISFCDAYNIAKKDQLLELFRRVKTPGCSDLSYYFEEAKPRYVGIGEWRHEFGYVPPPLRKT
uniref:RNA1 polyprotein n=1 Tax=Green Sichuan pepper nepovirus TaxID=2802553 RepID=A0A8F3EVH7_9SECO|nr:replication-associated protein [Green Sichuan pepper nepovirus]